MNSFGTIFENKADFFIIKIKDIPFENVLLRNPFWESKQET